MHENFISALRDNNGVVVFPDKVSMHKFTSEMGFHFHSSFPGPGVKLTEYVGIKIMHQEEFEAYKLAQV